MHHGFLPLDSQFCSIFLGPLRVVHTISSLDENQHRWDGNRDAVSGQDRGARNSRPSLGACRLTSGDDVGQPLLVYVAF